MESTVIEEGAEAPETEASGDHYYMKALNYLTSSSSENVQSDSETCSCLSSEDKDDDHFTSGFRGGLTRDQDDLNSSGSTSSSPAGSDGRTSDSFSAVSSPTPGSPRRQRKCSIGGRFYKTGPSEFGKIEPKRKLSDGHVHWADEFHRDLARCHPRKTYSRHPSHVSHQVKPILKPNHDDGEEC